MMSTNTCEDLQRQLHPFVDGELEAEEVEAVRSALAECSDCAADLEELETLRTLAREAFEAPVEAVDLSPTFAGVMARLEAEGALRSPAEATPSVREEVPAAAARPAEERERIDLIGAFAGWLGDLITFQRPVMSLAAAAAIAAVVWIGAGGLEGAPGEDPQAGGPAVAGTEVAPPALESDGPRATPRRGMETEVAVSPSFESEVESYEATHGQVFVENEGNPDAPMVVWHVVDEGQSNKAEAL